MIQFFKDCIQFILNCFQSLIEYITFWDDHIEIDLPDALLIYEPFRFMLYCWIGILLLTVVLKITGKLKNFKEGITAGVSILIIFLSYVFLSIYNPLGLAKYIPSVLPFVEIQSDRLLLTAYRFTENGFVDITRFFIHLGHMFLLALVVNQIYSYHPGNLKTSGWLVYRFFSNMFCFVAHYGLFAVLSKCIRMVPNHPFLQALLPHLPTILFGGLLALFIVGSIKKLIAKFFKMVNFAFEGMNGFFYSNKFGVIVTRAICTTLLLAVFLYFLQQICEAYYLQPAVPFENLSSMAIVSLVGLFILWILVGFLL